MAAYRHNAALIRGAGGHGCLLFIQLNVNEIETYDGEDGLVRVMNLSIFYFNDSTINTFF